MAKRVSLKRFKNVHNNLKSRFDENWKDLMKELQDHFLPIKGEGLDGDAQSDFGKQKYEKILHSEGVISARVLADGISSSVVPATKKWFGLTLNDKALMEMTHIKETLEQTEDLIFSATQQSNFYKIANDVFSEMIVFGTGAAFIEEDINNTIRLTPITMGTYYIGVGTDSKVNTITREFLMTAFNVVKEFGKDNVSQRVMDKVTGEDKTGDQLINIRHIIEPNDDRDITKIDITNKPFRSVYYEAEAADTDKALRESGFDMFPVVVSRWKNKGSEVMGRSPAMDALPDSREMQLHKSTLLMLGNQAAQPSYLVDSKLKGSSTLNLKRNGITSVDGLMTANGRAVQQVQTPSQAMGEVRGLIDDVKNAIKSKMYADLFFLITQQARANTTATEIDERSNEKFEALGRVMESMTTEFINPAIDIIYEILFRQGKLPEIPEELIGQTINIKVISSLARAQRLRDIDPLRELIVFTTQLAQLDPSAVKKLNVKQMIDIFARSAGVESGAIFSDEIVAQMEQQEAAEIERQQRIVEQQAAVQNAQAMSQTDTGGDNLLTVAAG